jgi:hypothetical protein
MDCVDWGQAFDQWNQCQLKNETVPETLKIQMSPFLPFHGFPSSRYAVLYNSLDECNRKIAHHTSINDSRETQRWVNAKKTIQHKISNAVNFPEKPIPPSTFHKMKLFILPHSGIGDHVNMIGAIRYLSMLYDEVLIGVISHYEHNVQTFYIDDASFKVYKIYQKNILDPLSFSLDIFRNQGYEILVPTICCWGGKQIGGYKNKTSDIFYRIFYEQCGLSYDVHRWNFTYVPRHFERDQQIIKRMGLVGKPYIFAHGTQNVLDIIYKLNNENLPIITPDPNMSLLEHCVLIENAAKIYVMDSSFFCLCSILNTRHINHKHYFVRDVSTNNKYMDHRCGYLHPSDNKWVEHQMMPSHEKKLKNISSNRHTNTKLKIAILNNHSTAAVFFANIFKTLGHTVYIPLNCSIENGALSGTDVMNARNIDPQLSYVKTMDEFDFYSNNNSSTRSIYDILLQNFDLIITYHPICIKLNEQLTKQHIIPVMLIIWGDTEIIHPYIRPFYNSILNNPNVTITVCHSYLMRYMNNSLYNSIKLIPLGLPSMIKYENSYVGNTNDVLFIQSRFQKPFWSSTRDFIHTLALAMPSVSFIIGGKDNENYIPPSENIKKRTFKTTDELYSFMACCKLFIANNAGDMILQYSPIEASAIGLPILYNVNTVRICEEIGQHELFTFDTTQSCVDKIKHLLNIPMLELKTEQTYQTKLYTSRKFENVLTLWSSEINNIFHNRSKISPPSKSRLNTRLSRTKNTFKRTTSPTRSKKSIHLSNNVAFHRLNQIIMPQRNNTNIRPIQIAPQRRNPNTRQIQITPQKRNTNTRQIQITPQKRNPNTRQIQIMPQKRISRNFIRRAFINSRRRSMSRGAVKKRNIRMT